MKKYSLARDTLYPETALVDPLLTLGLPRAVTVSTGLDALSHALESIWNVNANPVSSALAEVAAREVLDALPLLADDLGNEALRTRLARASLFAGPRLLQHPHRARPCALLSPDAASRRAARHRLLVQPAHGDARRRGLRSGLRRRPAAHLRPRPRGRRGAARGFPARGSASRPTPPTTASRRATGRAWSTTRLAGERGRNFIGRRESARRPKWLPRQTNDNGGNNDQDHASHIRSFSPPARAGGAAIAQAQQVLKVGLIPSEDSRAMLAQSKDILDALEKNLGMKVQGFVATDYNGVIEALRAKHLDIAYLGPFSYVLATTVTPVEAFAIAETAKSGRTYYHSQIIALKIERHQNARRPQGQELRLRRSGLDLGLRLPAGRPAEGRHRAQARLQDGDLHRRARRQRARRRQRQGRRRHHRRPHPRRRHRQGPHQGRPDPGRVALRADPRIADGVAQGPLARAEGQGARPPSSTSRTSTGPTRAS